MYEVGGMADCEFSIPRDLQKIDGGDDTSVS
jgi:hypothetical protein